MKKIITFISRVRVAIPTTARAIAAAAYKVAGVSKRLGDFMTEIAVRASEATEK